MHWNLLFGLFVVVLVAAEAEILKDPSSGFVEPKFYSSDDFENEWETFKINYGNDIYSIGLVRTLQTI